jgi:hypothetical protein
MQDDLERILKMIEIQRSNIFASTDLLMFLQQIECELIMIKSRIKYDSKLPTSW